MLVVVLRVLLDGDVRQCAICGGLLTDRNMSTLWVIMRASSVKFKTH
jgi:hypothetical protein